MDGPIERGDQLWQRTPNGGWLRWNRATSAWEHSSFGPPAPPPPPPGSGPEAAPDQAPRRGLVIAAAALAGLLVVTVAGGAFLSGAAVDTPLSGPPPAPVPTATRERAVYEFAPLLASSCLAEPTDDQLRTARAQVPDRFDPRLRSIAETVTAMRSVRFRRPVKAVLTTTSEISRLIEREVKTGPRAAIEERVLKALGAVPQDMDLTGTIKEAVGQDVLGFYKPGSKTIYSPRIVGARDPLSEVTLAHELEHALMDQHLGLPLERRSPALEADAELAARALIEGDASLVTQDYIFFGLDSQGRIDLGADPSIQGAGSSELPYFIEQAVSFPYAEGLFFACYLYDKGGWDAINKAYENPPRSTAEILFPDRYGTSEPPVDVPDPRVRGPWERVARMSVGAADLLWLFAAPAGVVGDRNGPLERVRVWNGGEIHAYERGDRFGFVMSLAGKSVDDPSRGPSLMCSETYAWVTESWPAEMKRSGDYIIHQQPDGTHVVMRCFDFGPRVAFAPDLDSAYQLLGGKRP